MLRGHFLLGNRNYTEWMNLLLARIVEMERMKRFDRPYPDNLKISRAWIGLTIFRLV